MQEFDNRAEHPAGEASSYASVGAHEAAAQCLTEANDLLAGLWLPWRRFKRWSGR